MDWRHITFDWNRLRAFLVTAEEGSFSAAARALSMTQPTLGRQVSALEAELGVTLFQRVGRGQELTPAGMELLEHARHMGEAAGRVSLAATGQNQSIEGSVCITASEMYSAHLLPPVVARLRREAPGIRIEILASNAIRDLRRREADIAVRNAAPTQPDLIARRLRDDQAGLFASHGYVAANGPFDTPADLARADFLGFDNPDVMLDGLIERGLPLTRVNFPVLSASHLVQWAMVLEGVGIGIVPLSVARNAPGIARILPRSEPITFPIWLTAHRELRTSRRVRLVYDMLAEELSRPG